MLPDVALSIADGSLATSAAVAVGTGAVTLGTLLLGRGDELNKRFVEDVHAQDPVHHGGFLLQMRYIPELRMARERMTDMY